jgi:hypothetical protein
MTPLKKYFFVLAFIFSVSFLWSQSGYTYCDWDKIKFDLKYTPAEGDTAIIFVSTRNFFPDKTQFFDYDFDTTHTLHYFNIYFNHNNWVCVKRKNLEEAYEKTIKSKDIVVYGEGMGKTFPANIDRATRFTRLYNVTTIMFDWPTFRPFLSGGKNYRTARYESVEVSKCLAKLFVDLDKLHSSGATGVVNTSLLLHSLGNRLLKDAVTHHFITTQGKLFDNIILNAACVKTFRHKSWVQKLNIQREIYITKNNHDRTLLLAGIAGLSKQLGRHSGWCKAKNAVYLNFSKVLIHDHNYFLMNHVFRQNPQIKTVFDDLFHGRIMSFDDQKKFRKRKNGRVITLKALPVSQDGDISFSISG